VSETLRSCVVGLGSMGRNHVRILGDLAGTTLVGVADPSETSRRSCRAPASARPYEDYRKMLDVERPDYLVVSVPTDLHSEVACEALNRGIHVLVEKPIAKTIAEAEQMIAKAKEQGVMLMVGHIERFNPAVQAIKRSVEERALGPLFQLHARRLSPFPARIGDVGVILDLATHDIDAMHFVTGSHVTRAYAETARKAHKTCEDMLCGLLRFASGEIGVLDVSWLSPKKIRELWVVGEGGTLMADYLSQDLYWYKNGRVNESWTPASHFSGAIEGDMIKSYIPKKEPLLAEHQAFLRALREGLPSPVTGEDGLAAMRVALDLISCGQKHFPSERP
jgi:UDP-N-acetylglucosamine 3-dehydrogenase